MHEYISFMTLSIVLIKIVNYCHDLIECGEVVTKAYLSTVINLHAQTVVTVKKSYYILFQP